ncbi:MAG TPA: DUF5318 family protein [Candidatus Nanopelagicales bacterium]
MAIPRGGAGRAVRATRIRGERPAEPSRPRSVPVAEPVSEPTRPRALVDYALARRALLERVGSASLLSRDLEQVCDADPYLLRAARHHGEQTERRCPICRKVELVHVTYVFGDELGPYSGRVKPSVELPQMAHEHGEFRVYVVEVCTGCGWNHLHLSYTLGDGVPRRPPRRPPDLLD